MKIFPSSAYIIKRIIFFFISLILFFALLVLVSEGTLRLFFLAKNFLDPPGRNFEKYLGWQTKPDNKWVKDVPGFGKIIYATGSYGFRVFGDLKTKNKKIFVIGDSHTQACQVSNGGRLL